MLALSEATLEQEKSTQTMKRQLPDDLITDYASGSLSAPFGLLVSTYAHFHPEVGETVRAQEAVGGALLDELAPSAMSITVDGLLDRLPTQEDTRHTDVGAQSVQADLPAVLRPHVAGQSWKSISRAVSWMPLCEDKSGVRCQLLRVAPGAPTINHTHRGTEYTLVLGGGFSDVTGQYGPGDLSVCDGAVTHLPTADADGPCTVLVVTVGGIRATGVVGALFNVFAPRLF